MSDQDDTGRLPCLKRPDPYDVLIETEGRYTARIGYALSEAVSMCFECPVQAQCLLVENQDETWAKMVVAGLRKFNLEAAS